MQKLGHWFCEMLKIRQILDNGNLCS